MSGRSSWCFTDDHPGCRYAACTCACHALPAVPAAEASAAAPRPAVPDDPRDDPRDDPLAVPPVPVAPVVPVEARPVPLGAQAELGFPDGLDGSTDDVVTVALSFRGQVYEVDLSRQHRDELRAALAPFVAVARVVRPARPGATVSTAH